MITYWVYCQAQISNLFNFMQNMELKWNDYYYIMIV